MDCVRTLRIDLPLFADEDKAENLNLDHLLVARCSLAGRFEGTRALHLHAAVFICESARRRLG